MPGRGPVETTADGRVLTTTAPPPGQSSGGSPQRGATGNAGLDAQLSAGSTGNPYISQGWAAGHGGQRDPRNAEIYGDGNYTGYLQPSPADANAQQLAAAKAAQDALIQKYHALAAGDPNSIAQRALRDSVMRAQSASMATAASRRGVSAGAQLRGGQRAQNEIGAQGGADAALLMAQEQEQARQMLAQLYGAQRGQDLSQADLGAQLGGANQGLTDMYQTFNRGLGAQRATDLMNNALNARRASMGLEAKQRELNNQWANSIAGGAAGGVGTLATLYNRKDDK